MDDNIYRDFIVNISRIQLEQDTGKAFTQKSKMNDYDTLVDLNRCNMALIEIVTKPNMRLGAIIIIYNWIIKNFSLGPHLKL